MQSEKNTSELERFLQEVREDGVEDSEGQFSLAKEKRLAKLAEFQLLTDSTWAVKVVQSAVFANPGKPISVTLGGKDARFVFSASWVLEEIEHGFFDPDQLPNEGLMFLAQALWSVGVSQERAFLLTLENQNQALFWDGETLQRKPSRRSEKTVLTVSHKAKKDVLFGLDMFRPGQINAGLGRALQNCCFVCPSPLSVDSRRIDSILNCPRFGWPGSASPLAVDFAECDIPGLSIPSGTFSSVAAPGFLGRDETIGDDNLSHSGFRTIGKKNLKRVTVFRERAFPMLLSYRVRPTHSCVFWVKHGAIVGKDELCEKTYCGVACYLSAEGMDTDLTGLQLEQSEERERRLQAAKKAAIDVLSGRWWRMLPLRALENGAAAVDTTIGLGTILSGAVMLFASPPVGAFLFVGALGASLRRVNTSPSKKHFREIEDSIQSLLNALKAK